MLHDEGGSLMVSSSRDRAALDRLLELVVVISNDMETSLTARGLTGARAHVLWELQHHGPMTQRQLATALDVTPRNITGLIDALAATGFVTREPHPSDRRATLVTFTDHGATAAANLEREHEGFAHLLFADVPDGALAGFVSGIEHVLGRLYEHGVTRTEEISA
jgi:DNA-binding MarR family transcriptional regulator